MTYKIEWEREPDRGARHEITGLPDPLPHPDHMRIDLRRGTAAIVGPASREEKAEWDAWKSRKRRFEEEVEELAEMIDAEQDPDRRAFLEADRAQTVKVIGIIEKGLGKKGTLGFSSEADGRCNQVQSTKTRHLRT